MKILIACEFSGIVREAFKKKCHDAWSCDLLPTEIPGNHYQGDVFDIINDGWDMMIAHPPCTYLTYAGIGYFNISKYGFKAINRYREREKAMGFFWELYHSKIKKICIENPRGYASRFIPYSQLIHSYYFGDKEKKSTCLWLKNLPQLQYFFKNELFEQTATEEPKPYATTKKGKKLYFSDYMQFSEDRWKIRAKTFQGIADAMANQWG